jgi:hypothetical protein
MKLKSGGGLLTMTRADLRRRSIVAGAIGAAVIALLAWMLAGVADDLSRMLEETL